MTMESVPECLLRPAPRASEHGLETVTIKAGSVTGRTQLFTIHKDLICKSSNFFKSAFNGQFLEGGTGCLELKTVDPMTFEVLYQWLYTGSLHSIVADVDIGLLCLRVFTMAHQYMVHPLQEIGYYYFRKTFHDSYPVIPAMSCVRELYESDLPTNLVDMLKSYLILHCAYWIMDGSCNCWDWENVLRHPMFGADIAWELTKRGSNNYVGVQSHPRHNVKFANHNGHVFVKKDCDDEEVLGETASSDDEKNQEGPSPSSQNTGDGEDTEAASDEHNWQSVDEMLRHFLTLQSQGF